MLFHVKKMYCFLDSALKYYQKHTKGIGISVIFIKLIGALFPTGSVQRDINATKLEKIQTMVTRASTTSVGPFFLCLD